jgi:hypothetical protein
VSNIIGKGDHFGEEIILIDCLVYYTVKSMTYLNVNALSQEKLQVFIANSHGAYPETTSLMRKAKVRMSFLRVMCNINRAFRAHHNKPKPLKAELARYRAVLAKIGQEKTLQAQRVLLNVRVTLWLAHRRRRRRRRRRHPLIITSIAIVIIIIII